VIALLLSVLLLQDLATLSGQGTQAIREKRYADAARIYRDLAMRDAGNPMWHMNLGMALESSGEHFAALAELSVFLKARPAPGPAHLFAGLARLKLDQPCEAIELLEKARQWQASPAVLIELGDAYHGCQRWDQAAEAYQAASLQTPRDTKVARQAARCWWLARQYAKARPIYATLAAAFPADAGFQYEYGDTLVRLQGAAAGLARLEKAVAAAPGLLPARGALGRALMELKRPADALPHLEAASPEDPALLLPLSQAYKALGRAEDAARAQAEYRERVK
jgi:tetratricopeptide (TPR) repeat protein